MKPIILISGLLSLTGICFGQTYTSKDELPTVICANGFEIALNSLGYTKIFLKDGTAKKNCIIKEIKPNWVVFIKDKVLHDIMIDKIKKIEQEDGTISIYFDEKNKFIISR